MKKVNTHGHKMNGLRRASSETINWNPRFGGHTQISYDMSTGDILTNDHIGQSWSEYHDPDIIPVCHTSRHMTMQQIADAIDDAIVNHLSCMRYLQQSRD